MRELSEIRQASTWENFTTPIRGRPIIGQHISTHVLRSIIGMDSRHSGEDLQSPLSWWRDPRHEIEVYFDLFG